jgi:hypothetical protein
VHLASNRYEKVDDSPSDSKDSVFITYEQPQTPPQQRLSQEGSYQQQSYKPEAAVLGPFFFAFPVLFPIVNTSILNLTTKRKNSSVKGSESAIQNFPAFGRI